MSIHHQSRHPTESSDHLAIFVHESRVGVVLRLVGHVDTTTAADLAAAIHQADTGQTRVVVDLSRVAFLDSAGLAALIAAHEHAKQRGSELVLRAVPDHVVRLLRMTGLGAFFGSIELAGIGRSIWCTHSGTVT